MDSKVKFTSYNSTGLGPSRTEFIQLLLNCSLTFLLVQESWHIDNNTDHIRGLHEDYHCYPISGMDSSKEILYGRPYGGLLIYYHKSVSGRVSHVNTHNRRFSCVSVKLGVHKMFIFNVYLPNDNYSQVMCTEEFKKCVDSVEAFVSENVSDNDKIIIGGDCNVDPSRNNAHFRYWDDMLTRLGLKACWSHSAAVNDNTYVANNNLSESCIDHFYCSSSLFNGITKNNVLFHALNKSNHRPINLEINLDLNSETQGEGKVFSKRTAWHKATSNHLDSYKELLGEHLDNITVEPGCLCRDIMCKVIHHHQDINSYADMIVQCMLDASENLPKTSKSKRIPYWNQEVMPLRQKALFWHQLWVDNGKPRMGLVADIMRKSRRLYHLKVKELQRSKEQNKFSRMAEAISKSNDRDLWKEVKKLSNSGAQADCIDGITGNQAIADHFASRYKDVYNSVGYSNDNLEDLKAELNELIKDSDSERDQYVTVQEVDKAVAKLNLNKHDGNLGLFSNHFKHAPKQLHVHLSMLFTAMLTHGCTPHELKIATLTSIPKDLKQSLSDSNNYRGISLCSILCKVYDLVI